MSKIRCNAVGLMTPAERKACGSLIKKEENCTEEPVGSSSKHALYNEISLKKEDLKNEAVNTWTAILSLVQLLKLSVFGRYQKHSKK